MIPLLLLGGAVAAAGVAYTQKPEQRSTLGQLIFGAPAEPTAAEKALDFAKWGLAAFGAYTIAKHAKVI